MPIFSLFIRRVQSFQICRKMITNYLKISYHVMDIISILYYGLMVYILNIINERDLRKCQFLRISAFCISDVLSLKQKWMTFYYLPSWRSIQEKRCAALKSGVCKDIYFTLQLVIHRNNAKNITMSSYVSSISSNLVFYHFLYT